MKQIIIGIAGRAGAGKTTAAQQLERAWNYRRLSFSSPIKTMGREFFAMTDDELFGSKPEPARRMLQGIGDMLRAFDPNWLIYSMQDAINQVPEDHHIVIDDIRMPEEAELVRSLGGKIVLMICEDKSPCTPEQAQHSTERDVEGIDCDILIDLPWGSVNEIRAKITTAAEKWAHS